MADNLFRKNDISNDGASSLDSLKMQVKSAMKEHMMVDPVKSLFQKLKDCKSDEDSKALKNEAKAILLAKKDERNSITTPDGRLPFDKEIMKLAEAFGFKDELKESGENIYNYYKGYGDLLSAFQAALSADMGDKALESGMELARSKIEACKNLREFEQFKEYAKSNQLDGLPGFKETIEGILDSKKKDAKTLWSKNVAEGEPEEAYQAAKDWGLTNEMLSTAHNLYIQAEKQGKLWTVAAIAEECANIEGESESTWKERMREAGIELLGMAIFEAAASEDEKAGIIQKYGITTEERQRAAMKAIKEWMHKAVNKHQMDNIEAIRAAEGLSPEGINAIREEFLKEARGAGEYWHAAGILKFFLMTKDAVEIPEEVKAAYRDALEHDLAVADQIKNSQAYQNSAYERNKALHIYKTTAKKAKDLRCTDIAQYAALNAADEMIKGNNPNGAREMLAEYGLLGIFDSS